MALGAGCSLWHTEDHRAAPTQTDDAAVSALTPDGAVAEASDAGTPSDAQGGDAAPDMPDAEPGCPPLTVYEDFDRDGHGNEQRVRVVCAPEPGWVLTRNDCNDQDGAVWKLTERGCVPPGPLRCVDKKPYCDALSTCYDENDRGGLCVCPGNYVDVAGDGSECRPAYRAGVSFGQRNQTDHLGDLVRDHEGNLWLSAEIYGSFALGKFIVGATGYTMMLAKFSPTGQVLWADSFDGPEWDSALAVDKQGDIWWTGNYVKSVNFGGSTHTGLGNQVFLAKRHPDGSHVLSLGFGGMGNDHGFAVATYGDSVFVAGSFEGSINFSPDQAPEAELSALAKRDMFLVEFDLEGHYKWSTSFGGPDDDIPSAVSAGPSGVAITGFYRSEIMADGESLPSGGNGSSDAWTCFLARFSPELELEDAQGFVLVSTPQNGAASRCLPYDLLEDRAGGLWLTGYFVQGFEVNGRATLKAPGDGIKSFLLKVEPDQRISVARSFGASDAYNTGESLALGPGGGVWLAGKSIGAVSFADEGEPYPALPGGFVAVALFDALGRHQRSMRFGNDQDGFMFRVESDGAQRMFLAGAFPGSFSLTGDPADAFPGDGVKHDLFIGSFQF
jgi:hypothetical protein